MRRLVFVEGVSGVGKSTAVTALGEALRSLGLNTRCHWEGDPDGPLDLCWVAYLTCQEYAALLDEHPAYAGALADNVIYRGEYILLRYQVYRERLFPPALHEELHRREFCYNPANPMPLAKFTEVFLRLWQKYAASEEAGMDYGVFDASLVSHMTSDLVRNYNAPAHAIAEHINTLLVAVQPLRPLVFYLASDDVRGRLIDARRSRGESPPTEEKIAFWEKRKQLDLAVLPQLTAETHILDISNGSWDAAMRKMLACVRT